MSRWAKKRRSSFWKINLYQPLLSLNIVRLARFQFSKMDRHHRHVLKNRERANRQRSARQATEIIPRLSLPASLISASSSARNEPINLGSGRAASGCKQPERHGWIIKSVPSTWSRLSKGFVVPRERSGNWSFRNGRNRKWEGFVVKRTWCTVTR